jgi:RluA family pseudouridine synthase
VEGSGEILYEDDGLLAVSKASGDLVIPGRGTEGPSLVERLSERLGGKLFVVHRLDRGASGLVLFARDRQSHRILSGLFEGRRVRKTYWAVVEGEVEQRDGLVDRPIRAFGSGRMGMDGRGKPSETRFRVLERYSRASWLEVNPLTGRRHQIRVHLFAVGHPILGDTRYGSGFPVGGAPRLMLHALRLAFPWKGNDSFEISCSPAGDFLKFLEGLRTPL